MLCSVRQHVMPVTLTPKNVKIPSGQCIGASSVLGWTSDLLLVGFMWECPHVSMVASAKLSVNLVPREASVPSISSEKFW